MADVLIHCCTLRVVRRGGWSWGPDPKRFVEEVVRAFPALLARKLSELLPEEEDREFAAPVHVRLPIRISEFLDERSTEFWVRPSVDVSSIAPLDDRVESALRAAFGLQKELPPEAQRLVRFSRPRLKSEEETPRTSRGKGGALQRLLLAWREEGVLERRLGALSTKEVKAWHGALRRDAAPPVEAVMETHSDLERQIEDVVRTRPPSFVDADPAEFMRQQIMIAVEVATRLRVAISNFMVWQILDRVLPVGDTLPLAGASAERAGAGGSTALRFAVNDSMVWQVLNRILPVGGTVPSAAAPAKGAGEGRPVVQHEERRGPAPTPAPHPVTSRDERPLAVLNTISSGREIQITCALPFLVLWPLARLGYFETLDAVLEAAELSGEAPLLATALAYKVLDAPERGWRRSPASTRAAATLAGLEAAPPEESLVDFSRKIASHVGPLNLILTEALIRGHTTGEPVLLRRADSESSNGFMLIDVQGCFPIAWVDGTESLLPILQRLDGTFLLISNEAAGPRVLKKLDAAGISFVSGVPPARGEPWQRIRQATSQPRWTNYSDTTSAPLLHSARLLAGASREAEELWETLAVSRPSVVRSPMSELDRNLTLAAAIAAGMIAWELWQGTVSTSPQLTLERFCDLDGWVRFTSDTVFVRLPLGRRHQELFEGGLLAPVSGIPWLEGHRVEFRGG